MPSGSCYDLYTFGLFESIGSHLSGFANEELTQEELSRIEHDPSYIGTSIPALFQQIRSIYVNEMGGEDYKLQPYTGDTLTKVGQFNKVITTEDTKKKLDKICEKFYQCCSELKLKSSTGPTFTAVLDIAQYAIMDMMNGRNFMEEMVNDPILAFAYTALTNLKSPAAGQENTVREREEMEYYSDRYPLYLMVQYSLDVHRKIRDFRDRIDPTDHETSEKVKASLLKTLEDYEKTTLSLLEKTRDNAFKDDLRRTFQANTWNLDVLGARGYQALILERIRSYKEALQNGIDPALLPQYSMMKKASVQVKDAVNLLSKNNADKRYNEVIEIAGTFSKAFENLRSNKDSAKSEQLMKAVCEIMNELSEAAGKVFKDDLPENQREAIRGLRTSDQSDLVRSFVPFSYIGKTVNQYYKVLHNRKELPKRGDIEKQRKRDQLKDISGNVLKDEQYFTSERRKKRAAFGRYNDMATYFKRKHEYSITGGIYDGAFKHESLFTPDFKKYFPRLVRRFPDLANPEVTDRVSALRPAAAQYVDILEEIVRKASDKLIATRHFVRNGKLLTDKTEIARLMERNGEQNPLRSYWFNIDQARAGLKDAQSVEDIQEIVRNLSNNFRDLQDDNRTKKDPDAAAAMKVALDDAVGEFKAFAGLSDYSSYFRNRVEVIGKYCRERDESLSAVDRLVSLFQVPGNQGNGNQYPLGAGDDQKMRELAQLATELKTSCQQLSQDEIEIGGRHYLPGPIDPDGRKVSHFLNVYDSLSPVLRDFFGNKMRELDMKASHDENTTDSIRNSFTNEGDLCLVSAENVERFCKLAREAGDATSFLFDHQVFVDYRNSLQAVSAYAATLKEAPLSTERMLHMAELMREAGRCAQTYLLAKGDNKRSTKVGNIRYNNAYAALYLTDPKEATRLAQKAKNLYVKADRTKDRREREHYSIEALMREEFGNLDRIYRNPAAGQAGHIAQHNAHRRPKGV